MAKQEIKMNPVVSSNLDAAGYDETTETLQVRFRNGTSYRYQGVSKTVYEGIFRAESPGKYFKDWVVKGKYKFEKLKND